MFGFIGDAVSSAANAVVGAATDVADAASDVVGAVEKGAEHAVEGVEDSAGGLAHAGDVVLSGAGELGEFAWSSVRETASLTELAVSESVTALGTGLSLGEQLVHGVDAIFNKALSAFDDARSWITSVVRTPLDLLSPRLGEAFSTILDIPSAMASSVGHDIEEAVSGVASAVDKLSHGDVGGALKALGTAALTAFVQLPADAAIVGGAAAISGVQTAVGLEPVGRKLRDDEIADLRKVYGDSIDYSRVRIKEGSAGLLGLGGRPMTRGDTIYIPSGTKVSTELLVHEMCHVWQNQHGGGDYMGEAIWAQNVTEGYDYAKGIAEGKSWEELNPEQQAHLLEEAYHKHFFDKPNAIFIVDGVDRSDYLRDALAKVHRGEGAA